jgi:hypothetical protein
VPADTDDAPDRKARSRSSSNTSAFSGDIVVTPLTVGVNVFVVPDTFKLIRFPLSDLMGVEIEFTILFLLTGAAFFLDNIIIEVC